MEYTANHGLSETIPISKEIREFTTIVKLGAIEGFNMNKGGYKVRLDKVMHSECKEGITAGVRVCVCACGER